MDDLGWPAISCYGNQYVDTRHIDQLAAEGMRFTDAYVTPQCTPTRASLLTGQHTARNKMWHVIPYYGFPKARLSEPRYLEGLPRTSVTVAEALQKDGYATAIFGKWHLHNWGSDGYYTRLFKEYAHYHGFDVVDPVTMPSEYQAVTDKGVDFLTDQAITYMRNHREQPFFVYLSHHTIHGPVLAPDSLINKYRAAGFPEEGQQNTTYLAAIHHFDHSIGKLMSALNALDLAKNTVVIFTSDNGGVDREFDNAPLRYGKGSPYEGGIRVPFIVRWPGKVGPGTVNHTPIHVVDIYPTLVDMANGTFPENHVLDGQSIVPLLTGQSDPTPRSLFWYMPLYDPQWGATPAAVIRKENYKLIRFFGDYIDLDQNSLYIPEPRVELYDLEADISESHDLTSERPALADSLDRELAAWLDELEVELPSVNPAFSNDSALVRSRLRPW